MKLTAEISNTEAALLDTVVEKGKIMFSKQQHSRYKNTLQANRISSHPLGVKKGFVKGEALRLYTPTLQEQPLNSISTNSNHFSVIEATQNVGLRHSYRTSEFTERESAL